MVTRRDWKEIDWKNWTVGGHTSWMGGFLELATENIVEATDVLEDIRNRRPLGRSDHVSIEVI